MLCSRWIRTCACYMNTLLLICTQAPVGTCSDEVIAQLRDTMALSRPGLPFPLQTSHVPLLCLLMMVQISQSCSPQILISIQGQTSASPVKQPLTDPHCTLGLSMESSCHPPKSSLSPTSLLIIVDPIPASSITLSLASIGPQSKTLKSLVSGSLKYQRQVCSGVFWLSGKMQQNLISSPCLWEQAKLHSLLSVLIHPYADILRML